ncbi:MAG: glycoside hydrolase family protein [Planctomycetota bacterium]
MKRVVQAVFILALVITMAIAGCEEQIAVENRHIKEKPGHVIEQERKSHHTKVVKRDDLIENGLFIQIPGPNPVITPGPDGAWDDGVTEAADAFKDVDTYYFYYHAKGAGKGYRLGVASSTHPLGPFKKHGDKPVLDLGPKDSWDDKYVACAMILKEGPKKYYMWYSGYGNQPRHRKWSIGLATAEHPLGPWKKSESNPILEDFGYVGGVLKVKGKYHLYSAYPISWRGYKGDYSPLALAVAEVPEGPYTKYEGNPLMEKGDFGDWDDGGISEAEVLYHDGIFHMFYGGTHLYGPRLESIGYAYSLDGYNFIKYLRNPVAVRQANPNAAAFAEVHAIIEPPFIYLYHTLRYEERDNKRFPWNEDLGVQVLVTRRPFSLNMPVLNIESLGAGETTKLADSPPISLGHITRLALTAECRYTDGAEKPIRVHIRSSYDGLKYDTMDLHTFDNDLRIGGKARKTVRFEPKVGFIKVLVENPDQDEEVSDVKVIVTLGG